MNALPLDKWIPNLNLPLVIAGPCSAESEEQVMSTARLLAQDKRITAFRAGIWKPRTRPGSFEGVGKVGLPWLQKVKKETGLMVTTEVANAHHVELALKHDIDILWIGARTTVSPFAVQEIAEALRGVGIPLMVKNPINPDLALWIGALERFAQVGISKLVAIHRGFSFGDKSKYRNPPLWRIPMELKRKFPNLPVICDPSHVGGKRDLIGAICQKAIDVDMDGLMVETHIDPTVALSDAAQQVTPEQLGDILTDIKLKTQFTASHQFDESLEALRGSIDRIDAEILEAICARMQTVEEIGKLKAEHNITALQVNRMDELLNKRATFAEYLGLRKEFAKEIFTVLHEESVKKQTDLMQAKQATESDGQQNTSLSPNS